MLNLYPIERSLAMDKGIMKLLLKSLLKHRVIYGNNGNKSVNVKITKVTIQKQLSNK